MGIMKIIYFNVGIVVTWIIIIVVILFFLYWIFIAINALILYVKSRNFFDYYMVRSRIDSDHLREKYKCWWVVKKHKKYILLYRLRNINDLKQ
jgi:uncharacterized membrane protein YobD (UPF0266 family)